MTEVDWIWFPKSSKPPDLARDIVRVFESAEPEIASESHDLNSNDVLLRIAPGLTSLGFSVESGKKKGQIIAVPVFFGRRGEPEKSFYPDAYWEEKGFVVEVEAGQAVDNHRFLKDLFEACMMNGVVYLCIAVRKIYKGGKDFEQVVKFLETLYASNRLRLPLEGILVVGY